MRGRIKKVERMGTNGVTKTEREIDGRRRKRDEKQESRMAGREYISEGVKGSSFIRRGKKSRQVRGKTKHRGQKEQNNEEEP